jgi:hypothetical protein
MEVDMRNVKWLLATGLIVATTAGCVETNGYPTTAYNNGYPTASYNNGYPTAAYNNGYPATASNNGYPAVAYNNNYPAAVSNNGYYNNGPYNNGAAYRNAQTNPNNPNADYRYYRDASGNTVAVPYQR